MFARVLVRHEWPSVLAVPEDAVLSTGQRSVAMVMTGDGTFEPREVQLGRKWLYRQRKHFVIALARFW